MRTKKIYQPVLGWSAYKTGGWKEQFERIKRWHHRAKNASNEIDKKDFLDAFFENTERLRDWLINTDTLNEKVVNIFFNKENEYMKICIDLSNSHKHYSLDREPRHKYPPSEIYEYEPGTGNLDSNTSIKILCEGQKYDAFEVADNVLKALTDFLISYKLIE